MILQVQLGRPDDGATTNFEWMLRLENIALLRSFTVLWTLSISVSSIPVIISSGCLRIVINDAVDIQMLARSSRGGWHFRSHVQQTQHSRQSVLAPLCLFLCEHASGHINLMHTLVEPIV